MSDPKGVIDPRSTLQIRERAMRMAIDAQSLARGNLVELAVEIEGYLLGDNSRVLTPVPPVEQPQSPDPQSSEGESTETMVETVADDAPVIPGKSNLAADYVKHSSFDPGIAALSNGTTHPEQQD